MDRFPGLPEKIKKVNKLALEGGGSLGVAYLSIVEFLEKYGIEVQHFSGTSAGSIFASMMFLGADYKKAFETLNYLPWTDIGKGASYFRVIGSGGKADVENLRTLVGDAFDMLGFSRDITMSEAMVLTGKTIQIPATNETLSRVDVFDGVKLGANTPLRDVVTASCAVPMYFTTVRIGEYEYSDGGLTYNHPIDVWGIEEPETILGIRIDKGTVEVDSTGPNWKKKLIPKVLRRGFTLVRFLIETSNSSHIHDSLWKRIIRIESGNYSFLDWSLLSKEKSEILINNGREAIAKWLEDTK